MIDSLFGSKTRVKLLHLFLSHPGQSFYVREITRLIDEQINSVRRELANMLDVGVITSETSDNKLYYQVNKGYEFFVPLRAIFAGVTEDGAAPSLVVDEKTVKQQYIAAIASITSLRIAVLAGILVRGSTSPVDVLLVGSAPATKVKAAMAVIENLEGREINYTLLSYEEFYYRLSVRDKFITQILNTKHLIAIDKDSVLS